MPNRATLDHKFKRCARLQSRQVDIHHQLNICAGVGARNRLADATIFVTREPCPMCVGALLACDVEALVFAVSNPIDGAAGGALQLAQDGRLSRKLKVVSGIRCDEAEELFAKAGPVETLRSAEPLKTAAG